MNLKQRAKREPDYFAVPITELSPAAERLLDELRDHIDELRPRDMCTEPMIEGL